MAKVKWKIALLGQCFDHKDSNVSITLHLWECIKRLMKFGTFLDFKLNCQVSKYEEFFVL